MGSRGLLAIALLLAALGCASPEVRQLEQQRDELELKLERTRELVEVELPKVEEELRAVQARRTELTEEYRRLRRQVGLPAREGTP